MVLIREDEDKTAKNIVEGDPQSVINTNKDVPSSVDPLHSRRQPPRPVKELILMPKSILLKSILLLMQLLASLKNFVLFIFKYFGLSATLCFNFFGLALCLGCFDL